MNRLVILFVMLLSAQGVRAEWHTYELRRVLAYECDTDCVWVDSRSPVSRFGTGALWVDLDAAGQPKEMSWFAETEQYGNIWRYEFDERFTNTDVLNLSGLDGNRVLFMYYDPNERMSFFVDDGTGRTLYFNYWPPERF